MTVENEPGSNFDQISSGYRNIVLLFDTLNVSEANQAR